MQHSGEHGFHALDPVRGTVLACREASPPASDWTEAPGLDPARPGRWRLLVASEDNVVNEAIPFDQPPPMTKAAIRLT